VAFKKQRLKFPFRLSLFGAVLLMMILGSAISILRQQPSAALLQTASTSSAPSFRIIGYFTDWGTSVDQVRFNRLTHINYAFLFPQPDGSLRDLENPRKLTELVKQAHAQGVKILISVGGWGYDHQFEQLASSEAVRAVFVAGVAAFVDQHGLDGADIDWEYPLPGQSSQNYLALMQELRSALPKDKLLTSAVAALGGNADSIPATVFPLVDFLNIMAYDASGTDHSPYTFAEQSLDYWSGRGLPAEKTILGVPFYSRPGEIDYRTLVLENPASSNLDQILHLQNIEYYNGIPTIQRKTHLAVQRGSGVMIWELSQDADGANSLLEAIYQAAQKESSTQP
jgi:chitinase